MDLLLRPEFLLTAAVLVVGALLALFLNGAMPGTRRARRRAAGSSAGGSGGPGDDDGEWSRVPARAGQPAGELAEVVADRPGVTFADVAGLDDAIAELAEVREFLADPARFRAVGAELPKGILLCGPSGNGKTLLARALAGETGVPFHYVSAASFVEQYVGIGAARIRKLFRQAQRDAPAIVFIDELDAVGRRRSGGMSGDREFDHTLNQLLVELDGFEAAAGVLIVGATNRPELLDPALVRPGRFDRRILIDRPDVAGRESILRLHASRRPVSRQVDWRDVARQTAGLSGAELTRIVNEAALLAARRHRTRIAADDVHEAINRLVTGLRNNRVMGPDEKRLVAYHEAGHALLALLLRGVRPPPRVSIVTRSGATTRSPWSLGNDREVLTKRELMSQLIVLLGGRAAEVNTFGEPSSRAEDDLDDAAQLARRMVERWAMTGKFELAADAGDHDTDATGTSRPDPGVRKLLARAEQAARTILGDHAALLATVAETLVERETMAITAVAELTGLWSWKDDQPVEAEPPRRGRVS
ncbi:MAG: AAA family ATPase [Actinobacteria bacterium]|nr:AAA family ATPase [Actinomycetota bacterium]